MSSFINRPYIHFYSRHGNFQSIGITVKFREVIIRSGTTQFFSCCDKSLSDNIQECLWEPDGSAPLMRETKRWYIAHPALSPYSLYHWNRSLQQLFISPVQKVCHGAFHSSTKLQRCFPKLSCFQKLLRRGMHSPFITITFWLIPSSEWIPSEPCSSGQSHHG